MKRLQRALGFRSTVSDALNEASSETDFRIKLSATAVFWGHRIYLTDYSPERARGMPSKKLLKNSLVVAEAGLWGIVSHDLPRRDGAGARSFTAIETSGLVFRTLRRHRLDCQVVLTQLSYWRCKENGLDLRDGAVRTECGMPDMLEYMRESNTEEKSGVVYCDAELYLTYLSRLRDRVSY